MEQLVIEYQALRSEILSNSQIIAGVFTVTITAVAALIGLGVSKSRENWVVLLSPFTIMIPSMWFIWSQLESTVRIASYIQTNLEPALNLGWETKLLNLRLTNTMSDSIYTVSISTFYLALAFLCLALAWVFLIKDKRRRRRSVWLLSAFSTVLVISMLWLTTLLNNTMTVKHFQEAAEVWRVQQSSGSVEMDRYYPKIQNHEGPDSARGGGA